MRQRKTFGFSFWMKNPNLFIQNLASFPIVHISYNTEDAVPVHETIAIYESLLSRKETFVFISEGAFP